MLVELKARFDEENNINWAKKLEKAGCHVIYGLVGLKTHSKITLVVRREEDGIRRYVHLGTGNYNDSTAKLYTDCGILTCSPQPSARMPRPCSTCCPVTPSLWPGTGCQWRRCGCGTRCLAHDPPGDGTTLLARTRPAHIMAKMNSLCDQEIIAALYEASRGRGEDRADRSGASAACAQACPGLSENISVRSIVGNFLEHSRILYFLQRRQRGALHGQRGLDAAEIWTAGWRSCSRWRTRPLRPR